MPPWAGSPWSGLLSASYWTKSANGQTELFQGLTLTAWPRRLAALSAAASWARSVGFPPTPIRPTMCLPMGRMSDAPRALSPVPSSPNDGRPVIDALLRAVVDDRERAGRTIASTRRGILAREAKVGVGAPSAGLGDPEVAGLVEVDAARAVEPAGDRRPVVACAIVRLHARHGHDAAIIAIVSHLILCIRSSPVSVLTAAIPLQQNGCPNVYPLDVRLPEGTPGGWVRSVAGCAPHPRRPRA